MLSVSYMYKKILLSTIIVLSFGLYSSWLASAEQIANAFGNDEDNDNYGLSFVADLDPDQIVSDYEEYSDYEPSDASGKVYLFYDPYYNDLSYEVYLEGLSYYDGDDVEIIQIHLGMEGEKRH